MTILSRLRLAVTPDRFIALVVVAAACSLVLPSQWGERPDVWLPAWFILTGLSALLEFVAVPLPKGGSLSVATIPHVATILLIPPPFAAISLALAVGLEELIQRAPARKLVFNAAAFGLTGSLASMVVGSIGDIWTATRARPTDDATLLLLLLAAGGVYYTVNLLLTSAIVGLASGRDLAYVLRVETRSTALSEMGGATLGGLLAVIWTVQPTWVVLLILPAAVISRSLQYVRQLESETRSAVRALAVIVDDRDSTTYRHSERVAVCAVALASALGLPEDLVDLVEQAASVHDLGKIGVPDRVLLKPGPLSEDEREAMREHTGLGARILDHYEQFRPGAEIVLHHHEAYDGSGYPDGLAGDSIPLGARVVAVADAFDAMTSDRPYRRALSTDEAVRRLIAGTGSQWDPAVVAGFLRLVVDGRAPVPAPILPSTALAIRSALERDLPARWGGSGAATNEELRDLDRGAMPSPLPGETS